MKNEEAMFILNAYRPDGGDAGDATFCAALEQTRTDPVLGRWFAAQQAFDRAMCAKLGEVAPPAGLHEAILAGGKVSAASSVDQSARWRSPVWMALAASVAILLAGALALWPSRAAAATTLADFVLDDAGHGERHGGHGLETDALKAMLSQADRRLGGGLPVEFARLRAAGCRTISCDKCEILEVCFKRDGVWFHCYIARRGDFAALAQKAGTGFAEKNGMSIAMWADSTHYYLVATKAGRAALERLL